MIKRIDHILIHTPTVQKTIKEFEKVFGIEAVGPLKHYTYFSSGMFDFGNVAIEIVQMGEKKDFEPYLYGVAFEPEVSSWETIDKLDKKSIPHTLPLLAKADNNLSWTTISMSGLLDNPALIPYGNKGAVGNNFLTHMMAKFFSKLMEVKFIAQSMVKDIGKSSVFFCEYHDIPKIESRSLKEEENPYGITGVASIMIEKKEDNNTWEILGKPTDKTSVSLEFTASIENRLKHIVLNTTRDYNDKDIMIGDVKFRLKKDAN